MLTMRNRCSISGEEHSQYVYGTSHDYSSRSVLYVTNLSLSSSFTVHCCYDKIDLKKILASVWSLSCVDLHVFFQTSTVSKTFKAVKAATALV